MLLAIVVTLWLLASFAGGWRRVPISPNVLALCAQCGYDLRGLAAAAPCPECGASARRHFDETSWWYSHRASGSFLFSLVPLLLFPFAAPLTWYLLARVSGFTHAASRWMAVRTWGGTDWGMDEWAAMMTYQTPLAIILAIVWAFRATPTPPQLVRPLARAMLIGCLLVLLIEWMNDLVRWTDTGQHLVLVLALPIALGWHVLDRERGLASSTREAGQHPLPG